MNIKMMMILFLNLEMFAHELCCITKELAIKNLRREGIV